MREKAVSVFALMIVEVRDRFYVEKFVKKPAPPLPLVSVSNIDDAPCVETHAWCSLLVEGELENRE